MCVRVGEVEETIIGKAEHLSNTVCTWSGVDGEKNFRAGGNEAVGLSDSVAQSQSTITKSGGEHVRGVLY